MKLGTPDIDGQELRKILCDLVTQRRTTVKEMAKALQVSIGTVYSWMGKTGKASHLPPIKVIPEIVYRLNKAYMSPKTEVKTHEEVNEAFLAEMKREIEEQREILGRVRSEYNNHINIIKSLEETDTDLVLRISAGEKVLEDLVRYLEYKKSND